MLDIRRVIASAPKKPQDAALQALTTPWSEDALLRAGGGECGCNGGGQGGVGGGHLCIEGELGGVAGEHPCAGGEHVSLHPHPQFEREQFWLLDGWWSYRMVSARDAKTEWRTAPIPPEWDGRILVPFSPEAPLSQVERQLKPDELLWYKRSFLHPGAAFGQRGFVGGSDAPQSDPQSALQDASQEALQETGQSAPQDASQDALLETIQETGQRYLLHFEAVDYACACYCNGTPVGTHVGGYLPFTFDITDALAAGANELALCVFDPSEQGVQLRGKQKRERGGIWYTAQSGIWQTVWLEAVPVNHIAALRMSAEPDVGRLTLEATVCFEPHDLAHTQKVPEQPFALEARLFEGDRLAVVETTHTTQKNLAAATACATHENLASAATACAIRKKTLTITLNLENPHLWSPQDPYLYRLELTYGSDKVKSYCAFRSVAMASDEQGAVRLHLNHEPCFLRGVLDQGYWPDGLMTAPSDEALVFDIQAMKDLGFNMLRKHIKIESDRWYYHCDRLGMLVWQDMVCGGSPLSPWHTSYKPTFFRRSWEHFGDSPRHYRMLSSEEEAYRSEWAETCANTISYLGNHPSIVTWVLFNEGWGQFDARKATSMVRGLDPTRPIDAVSGWYDQGCGDFLSVHNYFRPLAVYQNGAGPRRAFVISEFGGLSYHLAQHSSLSSSYGYASYADAGAFKAAVRKVLTQAASLEQEGLAGFVYTQLSDVEEETNGLISYDRRVHKLANEDCS